MDDLDFEMYGQHETFPKVLDLKLYHYSVIPIKQQSGIVEQDTHASHKPNGLWVSVDDHWHQWCMSEGFHIGDRNFDSTIYTCRVLLDIHKASKLCYIQSADELRAFERTFGEQAKSYYPENAVRYHGIQWDLVAKLYHGIIIAPYLWECRLNNWWYYGWDVASGCIWNMDAIHYLRDVPLHTIPKYCDKSSSE